MDSKLIDEDCSIGKYNFMFSNLVNPLDLRIDRLTERLNKLEEKMESIDDDIVCNEEDLVAKILKPLELKMDKIIVMLRSFKA